jgi:hypothetical protein
MEEFCLWDDMIPCSLVKAVISEEHMLHAGFLLGLRFCCEAICASESLVEFHWTAWQECNS